MKRLKADRVSEMAAWRESFQQADFDQKQNKDVSNEVQPDTEMGFVTAVLTGFNSSGEALVGFSKINKNQSIVARTIISLKNCMIGRDVILAFESNDRTKPIVMGVLQTHSELKNTHNSSKEKNNQPLYPDVASFQAEVDEEYIEINAKHKLVLRCGEASITLQRDGRVIVRGADILTRSSGLNRIKGGAVQIN